MGTQQRRNVDVHTIERFITTYNRIDGHLRTLLKLGSDASFSEVLRGFATRYPARAGDAGFLRVVGDIRNVISHDRTRHYQHPAIPAEWLVVRLEELLKEIEKPPRVIPAFQCQVETLKIDDSISQALDLVRKHGFSQFPVYSGTRFRGLLTENGITRWLAQYNERETILDLADIPVRDALKEEESRVDCIFVERETLIEDVLNEFAQLTTLEAAIITHSGKKTEHPLGIVTRWNVFEHRQGTAVTESH